VRADVSPGVRAATVDAVELLKSDHRQLQEYCAHFSATADVARKRELAGLLCRALELHTRLEEEIFYPALLATTRDNELHDQALVEHQAARELMDRIRFPAGRSIVELDAYVTALADMTLQHIAEEERPGGMYDKAQRAELDLQMLGARLRAGRVALLETADTAQAYDTAARFRTAARMSPAQHAVWM
jgi:hypothetical protein